MSASFFLTGTDTGVGKTYTARALLRLARAAGFRCAAMKPICCGDREDAELLLAASSEGLTIDELNPVWLRTPAAPFSASSIEGVVIEVNPLLAQLAELRARFDFVVVEGVGGWMVPIRSDYFVSDLAVAMKLPVVIVTMNRLGCLSHSMLTLQSIAASGLECVGLVLNCAEQSADIASSTNEEVLRKISQVTILPMLSAEMQQLPAEWRRILEQGISSPGVA
ncbi:MAG: dethiobiotin synthase [Chthoniobacterales bacterium]